MDKEPGVKTRDILKHFANSKLVTHLNSCVHCRLFGTGCLFFKTCDNPKYIPGEKADWAVSIDRRYCTMMGRVAPRWVHTRNRDDEMAEVVADALVIDK